MWMIDPILMCDKHLIGEHGELHKFRHSFEKKHNMSKRIALGQIEPHSMQVRHDTLAQEMLKRGFNHNSPYNQPNVEHLIKNIVNTEESYRDLLNRCEKCKGRIK